MLYRIGLWVAAVTCAAHFVPSVSLAQTLQPSPSGPNPVGITATADTAFLAIGARASLGSRNKIPFKLVGFRPTNSGAPDIDFLIVSPSSGITPAGMTIGLNPNVVPYLFSGPFEREVLFAPIDNPSDVSIFLVSVFLKSPGRPAIQSVISQATRQPVLSPGEWVSVIGEHLSTPPITAPVSTAGLYPTLLGNSEVTFNGIAAPLLYVSNDRIDCVVPYGVAGSETVEVVVARRPSKGSQYYPSNIYYPSDPATLPLQAVSPGLFTMDQSGSGVAVAENVAPLNASATTPNSEGNPASAGSRIRIRAAGAGAWNYPFEEGALVLSPLGYMEGKFYNPISPIASVSLSIGGQPAKLL